ncbi:MAG: hypothetical protein ACFFFC_12610, partial [Candidatus Thorarchaeota archaeon]
MSSEGREYSDPRETDEDLDDESKERMRELAERLKEAMEEDEARENEEASRQMRELSDQLEREWYEEDEKDTGEAAKEVDAESQEVLNNMSEAREDLHDQYVHEMHEKCPAKEAFSEEARRYYGTERAEKEADPTETTDSYHDSGDGTMQVQKAESESELETEETPESEKDTEKSQSSNKGQLSEEAEPEPEQEDTSEQSPAPEPSEEATEARSPKSFNDNPEEAPMRGVGEGDLERSQSTRGSQETKQSTLDEFAEHDETAKESSEDTQDATETSSNEGTESVHDLEEDQSSSREVDDSSTDLEDADHSDPDAPDEFAEPQSDNEDQSEEIEAPDHESQDDASNVVQDEGSETSLDDSNESQVDTKETEAEQGETESDEEQEQGLAEILDVLTDHPSVKRDLWSGELYIEEGMHAPSMFPESREERLSRVLGEIWESLSEEEREKIRPLLFKDIDSEEDLGEALKQVPEVWDDSDFLAAQRDAIEYLSKSEDEKAESKPPKLIVDLQKFIAERRWLALLKLAKEFSEIEDDEPLHEPSVTAEWMPEVVDKMLELIPDLKERADFGRWYREYRTWVEVMTAKDAGVIADEPSPEQLKKIAAKFKVNRGTLRRWVKGETAPYLVSVLRKRMESDVSVSTPMFLPGIPRLYSEFLKVLRKHSDLKKSKDFLQRRKRVKLYYGFFDFALENVGMPLQALARAYAQKHGLSAPTVNDWGRGKRIPILLRQVAERESGIATPRPSKVSDAHRIRTWTEYKRILKRHPYLHDLLDFNDRNERVRAYFASLELKKRYPEMSYREIARRVGQPAGTVTNWFHKGLQSPFLVQLANNERKRREYENALSENARMNLIPSEQLYQSLKRFRKREHLTVRKVANSLLKLTEDLTRPISFAKLRSYNHENPRWLTELAKFIFENRGDIERLMRVRSENGLRVGIVENTLFIR